MDPLVEIATGRLRGRADRGTFSFRGIPYARSPRGELRFRGPQPPEPWAGVRDATHFGAAAPQTMPQMRLLARLVGIQAQWQAQDCLSLNVWTPSPGTARRPVLVWIHGGAFVLGAGSSFLYHGARLALRGDVVVVTLNYRLGVLSFLNHPELRARGIEANLGLRDQVRALEWVRENIAAFGGDPDNVTIFGESAGGMSVGTLLAAPRARGLFQRAILQSGAMHHVATQAEGARVAEAFLDGLGLSPDDAHAVRLVRTSDLLRAQQETTLRLGLRYAMPWQPSVDGEFLPRTALEALRAGEVARVPTLVGSNRDEWRLFMLADSGGRRLDEAGLRRRLARQLASEEDAKGVIDLYRATGRGRRSPARLWEAVQSDRVFHHPAQRVADGLATLGVPVWRYLFSWRPPLFGNQMGASHGMELPFVFGTLRDGALRRTLGASRGARSLSSRMQDAWIAFARSGRPGHDRLPDWPAYETGARATLDFDVDSRREEGPFADESAFWEPRLG